MTTEKIQSPRDTSCGGVMTLNKKVRYSFTRLTRDEVELLSLAVIAWTVLKIFKLNWGWGPQKPSRGSKLWFRKDCWTFLWQITSLHTPHTPSHQSRLHAIIPWPLDTVYMNSTRKGRILGTPSSCACNKDCTCRFRWISLEFSLVAKCNSRSIEKIS